MANLPFDRVVWNPLEKALSTDWNLNTSEQDRSLRDTMLALMNLRAPTSFSPSIGIGYPALAEGFIGGSFMVGSTNPAGMFVEILPGIGFLSNPSVTTGVDSISGLNDLSLYSPVALSSPQEIPVPAVSTVGYERFDRIEIKVDRRLSTSTTPVLNPSTGIFGTDLLKKTMSYSLDGDIGSVTASNPSTAGISRKQGVEAVIGSASPPEATSGYVTLAIVRVYQGMTSITGYHIQDVRNVIAPNGSFDVCLRARVEYVDGIFDFTEQIVSAPPGVYCTFVPFLDGSNDQTKMRGTFYIRCGDTSKYAITDASVHFGSHDTGMVGISAAYYGMTNGFTTVTIPYTASTSPGTLQNNLANYGVPSIPVSVNQDLLAFSLYGGEGGSATLNDESFPSSWISPPGSGGLMTIRAKVTRIAQ
jgi:hypothetical protein